MNSAPVSALPGNLSNRLCEYTRPWQPWRVMAAGLLAFALGGCGTPPESAAAAPRETAPKEAAAPAVVIPEAAKVSNDLTLREGDVVRIAFAGVPSMDTTMPIRRDGKITLPLLGEITAVGYTPVALQEHLVQLYAPQLVNKEVTVTVMSSSFSVFVSGAVMRPGRVSSDRPLTVLEAVMEAGGIDFNKANSAAVVVIRQSEGNRRYDINLKLILEGRQGDLFYLKPSDVVIVPEKFNWFK